jgi:hypothetical protein
MSMQHRHTRGGWVKGALLTFSLTGIAVVGYAGYKKFFSRPGESAIQQIPADVDMVVSLDTTPSPDQTEAFRQLGDAMKANGLDDEFTKGVDSMFGRTGLAPTVRQQLGTSFAMGMWGNGISSGQPDMIVLISLKDKSAAEQALKSSGKTTSQVGSHTVYEVSSSTFATMHNDFLVIAPNAKSLGHLDEVGSKGSIAQNSDFALARQGLAADTNLMCFISPKMISSISSKAPNLMKWMAFGASLQNSGLRFEFNSPLGPDGTKWAEQSATASPISPAAYQLLPSGALGVFAISQPGKYIQDGMNGFRDFGHDAVGGNPDMMDKGIADFEKETGLNFKNDVLSAMNGTLFMAAYPTSVAGQLRGNKASIDRELMRNGDMLLVLTKENGSDPTALVQKLEAYAQSHKVTITRDGDVSEAKPTETSEAAPTAPPAPGATPAPELSQPQNELEGKKFCWKMTGDALYFATSRELLDKAIAAKSGQNMSNDAPYMAMVQRTNRFAFAVNPFRIANSLRSGIADFAGGSAEGDAMMAVFGSKDAAMTMEMSYQNNTFSGSLYVPLNYEALVQQFKKLGSNERRPISPDMNSPQPPMGAPNAPESTPPFSAK